jgi:primosomal replication protein N
MNRLQMSGTVVERSALRYTPAGIPVIEMQMQHCSQQVEAGLARQLDFPFGAIAIGETAQQLAGVDLGGELQLSGFLAPRTRRSTRLLVHVLAFEQGAAGPAQDEPRADRGGNRP